MFDEPGGYPKKRRVVPCGAPIFTVFYGVFYINLKKTQLTQNSQQQLLRQVICTAMWWIPQASHWSVPCSGVSTPSGPWTTSPWRTVPRALWLGISGAGRVGKCGAQHVKKTTGPWNWHILLAKGSDLFFVNLASRKVLGIWRSMKQKPEGLIMPSIVAEVPLWSTIFSLLILIHHYDHPNS